MCPTARSGSSSAPSRSEYSNFASIPPMPGDGRHELVVAQKSADVARVDAPRGRKPAADEGRISPGVDPICPGSVPVWTTLVRIPAALRAVANVFAAVSVDGFVMTSISSPQRSGSGRWVADDDRSVEQAVHAPSPGLLPGRAEEVAELAGAALEPHVDDDGVQDLELLLARVITRGGNSQVPQRQVARLAEHGSVGCLGRELAPIAGRRLGRSRTGASRTTADAAAAPAPARPTRSTPADWGRRRPSRWCTRTSWPLQPRRSRPPARHTSHRPSGSRECLAGWASRCSAGSSFVQSSPLPAASTNRSAGSSTRRRMPLGSLRNTSTSACSSSLGRMPPPQPLVRLLGRGAPGSRPSMPGPELAASPRRGRGARLCPRRSPRGHRGGARVPGPPPRMRASATSAWQPAVRPRELSPLGARRGRVRKCPSPAWRGS